MYKLRINRQLTKPYRREYRKLDWQIYSNWTIWPTKSPSDHQLLILMMNNQSGTDAEWNSNTKHEVDNSMTKMNRTRAIERDSIDQREHKDFQQTKQSNKSNTKRIKSEKYWEEEKEYDWSFRFHVKTSHAMPHRIITCNSKLPPDWKWNEKPNLTIY